MMIEYKGHSCFRIKDFQDTGYKIIFDPYTAGAVPGYKNMDPKEERANIVLCSHEHEDHHGLDSVQIVEEDIANPFDIEVIETFHDPEKGALRGTNTIHIVTLRATGEKVVHYGDVGEKLDDLLTPENLEKVKDANWALVPIGGVYTYDAKQAIELIDRTTPKNTIVMHYRSDNWKCGYEHIGSVEDFLIEAMETCHEVKLAPYTYIDTFEETFPEGQILALQPEYV